MNPLPVQLVCWKSGRNFGPYWHVKLRRSTDGMMVTKCGLMVPPAPGILKNYLSVSSRPLDMCGVCWPEPPKAA